jgi:hypothetical protein
LWYVAHFELSSEVPLNSSPPTSFHPVGAFVTGGVAVVVVVVGAAVVVVVGAAVVVVVGAAVVVVVGAAVVVVVGAAVVVVVLGTTVVGVVAPGEGTDALPGTVVAGWQAASPSITIPAAIARAARGVFGACFITNTNFQVPPMCGPGNGMCIPVGVGNVQC